MDIPGWYQRFSTSQDCFLPPSTTAHQGLPSRLVCPSLLNIWFTFRFAAKDWQVDLTWFTSSSHTQNTARYKASRWRNTMVWFEIPVDLHHCDWWNPPWHGPRSRFRCTALGWRGAHFQGWKLDGMFASNRAGTIYRVSVSGVHWYGYTWIHFTCIVLKSYGIGLHGCILRCQLIQWFPEFINVVCRSDLEARQSEPLLRCRRRRFWLEGCSHPVCSVA